MTDYQVFDLTHDGVTNIGQRMSLKLNALDGVLPTDLTGMEVLDIGCDHGFWSFLCAERGAKKVVGLDRGRPVNGDYVDTPVLNTKKAIEFGLPCEFKHFEVGKQWTFHGDFDLVLLMSLYHHIYHNCEDHEAIWYWLWWQTKGMLIWENPTSTKDEVVKGNVNPELHSHYNEEEIFAAADKYFTREYIGPAIHSPTRDIYVFRPKNYEIHKYQGIVSSGAGGANKAFCYNDNLRIREIEHAMNLTCYPGSLNVYLDRDFDWDSRYFRAKISDVKDRSKGIDSEWEPRWARFYPVMIDNNVGGYVFRFEGENYPDNFIEIIATGRIRDFIKDSVSVYQL